MLYVDGHSGVATPLVILTAIFYPDKEACSTCMLLGFLMEEDTIMLIMNDEQCLQAGIRSLGERCKCCGRAFATYPLIMSDDAERTVYHAACAVELATEIMVGIYTFFNPPAPLERLFVLCVLPDKRDVAAS
jgi:hypothetical protein